MNLTPEERKRIYEEEKARHEAQEQFARETRAKAEEERKRRYWRSPWRLAVAAFFVLVGIEAVIPHRNTTPEPRATQWVAMEVTEYDTRYTPPRPNWTLFKVPGYSPYFKTRKECEDASGWHRQLIPGAAEWRCEET